MCPRPAINRDTRRGHEMSQFHGETLGKQPPGLWWSEGCLSTVTSLTLSERQRQTGLIGGSGAPLVVGFFIGPVKADYIAKVGHAYR